MDNKIDQTDLMILQTLYKKPGTSIRDFKDIIFLKSTSSINYRLRRLEGLGLINPPPTKHMARSRSITEFGIDVLRELKLIPYENRA